MLKYLRDIKMRSFNVLMAILLFLVGFCQAGVYNPATKEESMNFFNEVLGQYSYTLGNDEPISSAPYTFNCMAISYVLSNFLREKGYDAHLFGSEQANHAIVVVKLKTGWVIVEGVSAPKSMLGTISLKTDALEQDGFKEYKYYQTNLPWRDYIRTNSIKVELS